MVDYLNALSDRPLLQRSVEPADSRLDVVHRSEEGMLLYRVAPKVDRSLPEGYHELLVPARDARKVADPYHAEPRDEWLSQQFERRPVSADAQLRMDWPVNRLRSTHDMFEALCAAATRGDMDAVRSVDRAYLSSPEGQSWLMQGQQFNQQRAQEQQMARQIAAPIQHGPVM
jgi:hypothetical protein